jgi:hypothetical protein
MANKKFLNPINLVNLASDPSTASEGDIYYNTTDDVVKVYANSVWIAIGSGGGSAITVSDTAPSTPETGDAWYKNDTGEFYVYDGSFWVEVNGVVASNGFTTIAVSGEDNIVADSNTDTLTLIAGTNVTIETNATNDSITINADSKATSSVYLVRNNTGSTILKGTLVSASGAEPSGRIDVEPFAAVGGINSELTVMGMATTNISNGVNGEVISFGTLTGLDTRGNTTSAIAVGDETWAAGDILFAHPTVAGKLTNVRPQHDLAVAFITVRHASTGQIAVRIVPGNNHLEWMHDVTIDAPADNEVLAYDSGSSLWKNQLPDQLMLKVYNNTGSAIPALSPVYYVEDTVNGINVDIADSNSTLDPSKLPAIGITKSSISNGSSGNIVTYGKITGIDTTDFNSNDSLFVASGGGLTSSRPTGTANVQEVGKVLVGESSSNGEIIVYNTGRKNDIPNLAEGKVWLGNVTSYPVATTIDTSIVPEGSSGPYYFTDSRARAALSADLGGTNGGIRIIAPSNTSDATLSNDSATHQVIVKSSGNGTDVKGTLSVTASPSISDPGNLNVAGYIDSAGSITGSSIIKDGGTSSEFLKADGSVDTSTYLTTETDPVFVASEAYNITSTDTSNWDTAYGWGDHASAGYASDSHNHSLDSLSNVVITGTPTDGQAIVWDTTTSKWVNETVSGGASYPTQFGNTGKFLQTDGTDVSWQDVDLSSYVTLTGTETLSGKSISDNLYFDNPDTSASANIRQDSTGTFTITTNDVLYLEGANSIILANGIPGSSGQYLGSIDSNNQIAKIGDLSSFLTSESDTLETVTDRGATSSNAISITNTTASTSTSTGALVVSGGLGVGQDVWIEGDLHVAGTTVTENTKTVATHDNMIYLNAAYDSTITNAVGDGTYVTYTAENNYTPGMDIRVTGMDPSGYNIATADELTVYSATSTQFVVAKTTTGSFVSGGTAHAKEEVNPDLGFAGGYYDAGYAHAGLFRDASDGVFKFFQGYTPEPDEAVNIDTTHASFAFADIQIRNIKPQGSGQNDNFGIGYNATFNATGFANFGIGQNAFSGGSGTNNFAFGDDSMENNTGGRNFAFGDSALTNNTGDYNYGIGYNALQNNSGWDNYSIGPALYANTGDWNYAIGYSALSENTGDYNSAFGYEAGVNNTGSYNVYIGKSAGLSTSNNIVIADNEGNLRAQYLSADSGWTLGTIYSATWNGSAIDYQYGGTGLTAIGEVDSVIGVVLDGSLNPIIGWTPGIPSTNLSVAGGILVATGGTNPLAWLSLGTAGQVLKVNATEDGLEWGTGGGGSSFTDSAGLAALLSDETGTGLAVFNDTPTLTSPAISGGTINNASIGATTASTGRFTTVNLNGVALMEASTGTTSATSTFNTTVYSSAEFIVYASTASGNYVSKVLMLARGTATPVITEYAILTQGTAPSVTITPSYSAPNAVLTVGVTSGTNIEIIATEVSI